MNITLETPTDFPAFPFSPPYEIQVELMRHLYAAIEDRKVTIVESPTGTVSFTDLYSFSVSSLSQGKTLSLLCSSLTWLRDEKDRVRRGLLQQVSTEQSSGD